MGFQWSVGGIKFLLRVTHTRVHRCFFVWSETGVQILLFVYWRLIITWILLDSNVLNLFADFWTIVMTRCDLQKPTESTESMWERACFLTRLVASSVRVSETAGRVIKVCFIRISYIFFFCCLKFFYYFASFHVFLRLRLYLLFFENRWNAVLGFVLLHLPSS